LETPEDDLPGISQFRLRTIRNRLGPNLGSAPQGNGKNEKKTPKINLNNNTVEWVLRIRIRIRIRIRMFIFLLHYTYNAISYGDVY
jgi:hypothetical protein